MQEHLSTPVRSCPNSNYRNLKWDIYSRNLIQDSGSIWGDVYSITDFKVERNFKARECTKITQISWWTEKEDVKSDTRKINCYSTKTLTVGCPLHGFQSNFCRMKPSVRRLQLLEEQNRYWNLVKYFLVGRVFYDRRRVRGVTSTKPNFHPSRATLDYLNRTYHI